jgi:hypothetical protein
MKLGQDCYIVRDHDGQDIAKLPELLRRAPACALFESLPLILLFTLGNIHIGRLGFQATPCPASLGETNEISSRDIALTQGPRAGEGK